MNFDPHDRMRIPGGTLLGGQTRSGAALRFVLAAVWVIFSQICASILTRGSSFPWQDVLFRTVWLGLLLGGFWGMGKVLDGQKEPIRAMGLMQREDTLQEWALGVAVGWGAISVLVLPSMLFGALALSFWWSGRSLGLTLVSLITLAIGSLAEEVAFRGYPFQRLRDSVGPTMATILLSLVFGLVHYNNPHGGWAAVFVTVLAGIMLSIAYLRTRSLWLAWGLHFGWNASMGIVFGLPVSGLDVSGVVQTRPQPPIWLTGGLYGPEASILAPFVVIGTILVLVRVTRDLAWKYGHDPIVPGGYPMDAPPPPQHTALEAAAKPAPLVQIMPTTPQGSALPRRPEE